MQKFREVLQTTGRGSDYAHVPVQQGNPVNCNTTSDFRKTAQSSRHMVEGVAPVALPGFPLAPTTSFSSNLQGLASPTSISSLLVASEAQEFSTFTPPSVYGSNWYNVGEDHCMYRSWDQETESDVFLSFNFPRASWRIAFSGDSIRMASSSTGFDRVYHTVSLRWFCWYAFNRRSSCRAC